MAAEFVSNTIIQLTPELATRPVPADSGEFTIRPVTTTSTSLVPEMTDTYDTADTTSGAEAANQTSVSLETQKGGAPNVGLIVGSLLGTIALLGLILLGVRYWFIRRRKAHQADGSRPAYNKARFAISGPSDFRVVESGTGPALTAVGGTPLQLQSSIDSIGGSRNNGTSIGGRYPFDMSSMESGLSNHVKAMKDAGVGSAARKPVPTYKSDGDNKV